MVVVERWPTNGITRIRFVSNKLSFSDGTIALFAQQRGRAAHHALCVDIDPCSRQDRIFSHSRHGTHLMAIDGHSRRCTLPSSSPLLLLAHNIFPIAVSIVYPVSLLCTSSLHPISDAGFCGRPSTASASRPAAHSYVGRRVWATRHFGSKRPSAFRSGPAVFLRIYCRFCCFSFAVEPLHWYVWLIWRLFFPVNTAHRPRRLFYPHHHISIIEALRHERAQCSRNLSKWNMSAWWLASV